MGQCTNTTNTLPYVCAIFRLDTWGNVCYHVLVRQGGNTSGPGYGRREDMDQMTTAELNQYLENIAQLVEERTKDKDKETAEIAIQAIRNSKIKA